MGQGAGRGPGPANDQGSAVVEFALVLPLIVVLLVAVVEVAVVAKAQLEIVNAAREGAREAASSPDPARAAAVTRAALGPLADRARIDVTRPHVVGRPATVEIQVVHRIAAPVLGGMPIRLRGRATMRVER